MIRYFDTEADYLAAIQDIESQVSLIGENNECRFDGRNVVVGLNSATTGSIAVLDGLHVLRFIAPQTFSSKSFMSNYEIVGPVVIGVDHPDFRGEVAIANREFSGMPILVRYRFKLSGYTLDGTEHTGVLSIRSASNNWAANQDYTITYKADNIVALVSQLNAYFKANEPFIAQDWVAIADESGDVFLDFKYTNWQQSSYDTAKSGFSVSANNAPKWNKTTRMFRMNGRRDGGGTITNMPRALADFREDKSATSYNPAEDVKTVKLAYPICLPGYLGKSKYQTDHCAYLRSVYGEGEEGWLKFMKSFLPVLPSEYGIFDDDTYGSEKENTYYLASLKYVGQDGVERYSSPAARVVAEVHYDHELLKRGEWVIGSMSRIFSIVGQLRYSTTNDRNADKVNAALKAIGAPALSNASSIWSCSRYSEDSVWIVTSHGFAYGDSLYYLIISIPLVLLKLTAESVA